MLLKYAYCVRSESGTQTGDPCYTSLAYFFWAIGTKVKVQLTGTDLIVR